MGNWKNYDELEDQLSIEELIATIDAQRKAKKDEHRFMAMLQGINIPEENSVSDVTELKGALAISEGFGIGLGLGHSTMEVRNS